MQGLFRACRGLFLHRYRQSLETLQERCPYDWAVFEDQSSGVQNGLAARVGEAAAREFQRGV